MALIGFLDLMARGRRTAGRKKRRGRSAPWRGYACGSSRAFFRTGGGIIPSAKSLGGWIENYWRGVFPILPKNKDWEVGLGTLGYALRYKTAGGTLGDTLIRLKLYQLNRIPNFFCTKSLACHLKIPKEKIIFIGATTPTVAFFCSSN